MKASWRRLAKSPRLLLVIGPPAVGKTTVGREVCARTGFRFFNNHHTIEPLAEIFGMRTRAFTVLNHEFRRRVIEEAARDGIDLCFCFVWNLAGEDDLKFVVGLIEPYVAAELLVVELFADLPTRLARNHGDDRLLGKPSKRDSNWAEAHLLEREAEFTMNTTPGVRLPAHELLDRARHLRLDTTDLSARETSDLVVEWLGAST